MTTTAQPIFVDESGQALLFTISKGPHCKNTRELIEVIIARYASHELQAHGGKVTRKRSDAYLCIVDSSDNSSSYSTFSSEFIVDCVSVQFLTWRHDLMK